MIITAIRYLIQVVYHKICIIIAGICLNRQLSSTSYHVSLKRLWMHDLSKFSSSEFWPYAQYFYGERPNKELFHRAWLHHVSVNDHHWEHFIEEYPLVSKILFETPNLNLTIRPMPDQAILEMVVDNIAATKSYEGQWPIPMKKDGWKYLTENYQNYRFLHPNSKIKFTAFLCALGYEQALPDPFDWNSILHSQLTKEEKIQLLQLQQIKPRS